MDILNFNHVRLGKFPLSFDVQKECGHSEYAISAGFHLYDSKHGFARAEFRYLYYEYRLFLFRWKDQKVPSDWEGSELIWSIELRQE